MSSTAIASSIADDPQRLGIDALIRRELKIGDPRDPQQIAQALSQRYQSQPRAQAIRSEAQGLPFLYAPIARGPETPLRMATDIDLEQAREDVRQDLDHLVRDNQNKDIRPELEGWKSVLERAIDEGVNAARYGLDPHKRDLAFAMRRQLGDYARLARMIGAMTPSMNRDFRSLAMSLDEVSAVILVLMGESMANLGFAGGRFLLQTPYAELQARRDAVLQALRAFDGSGTQAPGHGFPRGLRAYRQLSQVLESRGQGDLRSLMNEAELARTMDELVQLASGNTPHGLRAIGATAWGPLNRMQHFVNGTLAQVAPASAELATLHEALLLFLEGFAPAGGFRLLRIARPVVLNYGLYGSTHITAAERRLMELVNRRGMLARELDSFTDGISERPMLLAQIVYDKMLYCIDRAIDYYAVGDVDLGLPEARAAAFSHLIRTGIVTDTPKPVITWTDPWEKDSTGTSPARPEYLALNHGEAQQKEVSRHLFVIWQLLRPVEGGLYSGSPWWEHSEEDYLALLSQNKAWTGPQPVTLRFPQVLRDELALSRLADTQLLPLVAQMTSGGLNVNQVLGQGAGGAKGCLPTVLDRALAEVRDLSGGTVSVQLPHFRGPAIPRHAEESLEDIAEEIRQVY